MSGLINDSRHTLTDSAEFVRFSAVIDEMLKLTQASYEKIVSITDENSRSVCAEYTGQELKDFSLFFEREVCGFGELLEKYCFNIADRITNGEALSMDFVILDIDYISRTFEQIDAECISVFENVLIRFEQYFDEDDDEELFNAVTDTLTEVKNQVIELKYNISNLIAGVTSLGEK